MTASGAATFRLRDIAQCLRAGGVIAYPTEAVYGLGCDPMNRHAVERVLAAKGRDAAKGLIVIGADVSQFRALVDARWRARIAEADTSVDTPGGHRATTWVVPSAAPAWLSGGRHTLAVRVTLHPQAADLCRTFGGPIVSTSANRAGRQPARTALQVRRWLGDVVDRVVSGPVGHDVQPSRIVELCSGRVLRP